MVRIAMTYLEQTNRIRINKIYGIGITSANEIL